MGQCQINVVYFIVRIYNVKQRRTNLQRRNNVVIFNVEFQNSRQRGIYVVKMTIYKSKKSFQTEHIEFKALTTIS